MNNYNPHAQYPMNYQYPEHLVAHVKKIQNDCIGYMKKKVKIITIDQKEYKGTIDYVDNDHVYLILDDVYREEPTNQEGDQRGYGGYPGYGFYPGYGYGGYPGYGYGYGPGYGFGPGLGGVILPLFGLAAISALR